MSRLAHLSATKPSSCSRPCRRGALCCTRTLVCRAQAIADAKVDVGYLAQLRETAMALHTKEQLGHKPTKESKEKRPEPTLVGYLRFLQESKLVWDCLEDIIARSDDPNCVFCRLVQPLLKIAVCMGQFLHHDITCAVVPFKSTGLERGPALSEDIQWFHDIQSLGPLPELPDGPGAEYAQLLTDLANDDVPAFLCHYYNIVFAHNAGGMMIGKSLSKKLLDGATLEFYTYEEDHKKLGAVVKDDLEKVAATWTTEERQRSVDQTKNTFQYAGSIMRCLVASE